MFPVFSLLKSYQKVSRTWKVRCLKRGVFEIRRVDLVGSDLLGFSSFSHSVQINACLTVLPRPLENNELALSASVSERGYRGGAGNFWPILFMLPACGNTPAGTHEPIH